MINYANISECATKAYYAGNFEEALKLYYKILANDLKDSTSYYNIALTYESMNELELAVSYYKKSIRINDKNVRSIDNLARIYIENIKDLEIAKIYLNKAIDVAPNDAEAYNLYGNISLIENNIDMAIAYFKKSIVLDEDYFKNYYDIAVAYFAKGDIVAAKTNVNKSIELNPAFSKAEELLQQLK